MVQEEPGPKEPVSPQEDPYTSANLSFFFPDYSMILDSSLVPEDFKVSSGTSEKNHCEFFPVQ